MVKILSTLLNNIIEIITITLKNSTALLNITNLLQLCKIICIKAPQILCIKIQIQPNLQTYREQTIDAVLIKYSFS